MANRAGKKGKKPLQTTLGKASGQNEKEIDLSHVQTPIHTSVFGLRQVLSLFETATEEVQNYITHECDIMYECRTCRTIFRSLANFVLHKRNYCRERFRHLDLLNNNEVNEESNACTDNTQNMGSRSNTPDQEPISKDTKKDLAPIIEKLKVKQEINQLAQDVLNEDLSSKEADGDFHKSDNKKKRSNDLLLETIATNNAAVFQTMLQNLPAQPLGKPDYMKSEVMEIHGILDSDEAVIGPDGKICNFETNKANENPLIPKGDLFCTECSLRFSTKKTLTYHIKYKHNYSRLVFVCPDCKDTFANAWCVYRHLYKIHRRTSAQIKRMREQIHNSCMRKDQEAAKKKDKKNQDKVDRTDEENQVLDFQWLNNIEGDNDFQMCGGCGKRFERKAALHSHAQMCIKRIAVCNTIKENSAKKKEEECKQENKIKTQKPEKNSPVEILKGSSKRKPYLLRTYKPIDRQMDERGSREICDVNANCEKIEPNCDSQNIKEEVRDTASKIRASLSSTEDLLSPSKICASPSVDRIDTEKMLNIIGVTPLSENLVIQNKEQLNSIPELTDKDESQSSLDFDMFCQNITEELAVGKSMETERNYQKISRTVPLILRRKNTSNSKSDKRNTIIDLNNKELSVTDIEKDIKKEHINLNENIMEQETVENETGELENLPSTSSFRINVKSLEKLIDTNSKDNHNHKVNPEAHSKQVSNINSADSNCTEVSDTIRANISPEKLPISIKRKRTASFDYTGLSKSLKLEAHSLSSKQGVSFIGKASPYMDQNKLSCIPCDLSYPSFSKLLWHMSAHFSWFRFQCSRCSFISFNKLDCANHAKRSHGVRKRSMQSIVLPIPNWKTVLMSHEFCTLKDDNDLSGKHTDEILSGIQDEATSEKEKGKDDDGTDEWDNNLFVDTTSPDTEMDYCDFSSNHDSIKQEDVDGIDVVEDSRESHQIEVPQEIYTLDVSEIMNGVDDREMERVRLMSDVKIEKVENDDKNWEEYHVKNTKIKSELTSDSENVEELPNCKRDEGSSKCETALKQNSDAIVNVRPTRNRIRSIKTLQDDFFYDLSKVIKLNDNSVNKPALQKHKRNNPGSSQRAAKESVSSSSKNEAKSIRVYSKRNKASNL